MCNAYGVPITVEYFSPLSLICITYLVKKTKAENHEKLTQWGVIRILVIDVWEHSYYLKYRNRRAEFVDSLFGIIPSRTIGNMPCWPGWVGTL